MDLFFEKKVRVQKITCIVKLGIYIYNKSVSKEEGSKTRADFFYINKYTWRVQTTSFRQVNLQVTVNIWNSTDLNLEFYSRNLGVSSQRSIYLIFLNISSKTKDKWRIFLDLPF